jgi:hypothetical protein
MPSFNSGYMTHTEWKPATVPSWKMRRVPDDLRICQPSPTEYLPSWLHTVLPAGACDSLTASSLSARFHAMYFSMSVVVDFKEPAAGNRVDR